MEAIGHNTTSARAMRLRVRVPVLAGAAACGNGDRIVATGSNLPSRGIADAGEQGVGIRVFATGGDV